MRTYMSIIWCLAFVLGSNSTAYGASAVTTRIVEIDGRYTFVRAGQPYSVRGAGIATHDLSSLDLEGFARSGGNSFRTWGTENAEVVLDRAHALGLTVALCLGLGRERQGFDYNDIAAVARQKARLREEVLRFRDHPALLAWIIGNELNLEHSNPAVYDAVNDIARMIRELDPAHPTTTTLAGFGRKQAQLINERAPELDFVSVQLYGDLVNLPKYLRQNRFKRPYMVTEWGAIGHWEMPSTFWNAPVEQHSSEKARTYKKMYNKVIQHDSPYNLGSYVFFWGQKQERTATWYGLFLPTGEATEVVDFMETQWTGRPPENQSPRIDTMRLYNRKAHANVQLKAGKTYSARVKAFDPDGDALQYRWEVRLESRSTLSGGDEEVNPPEVPGLLLSNRGPEVEIRAPGMGAYRLYVYVYDGRGKGAHANIPFVSRG